MQSIFARTRTRRLDRLTWTDGSQATLDLIKSYRCERPIARLRLRFAYRVTATAGGAVSGLTQDASVQLLANRIEIVGHHKELGQITIVDLSGQSLAQLWHLSNDLIGREQDFSDPTPGASTSSNGRREYTFVFDSPYAANRFLSYLDPRDFTQLQVKIEYGNDADYASTNLSDIDLATIDFEVEELVHGIQGNRPHFVPTYKEHQMTVGANTSTDLVGLGIVTGGYVPLVSIEPHDNSATGNSQRDIAGLVRRVSMRQGDDELLDKAEWTDLANETEHHFPKSFTTTRRIGPVTVLFDKDRNFAALVDNRAKSLTPILDTSSTVQQDITAVTAAANDRADFIFLSLRPTKPMQKVIDALAA